MIWKFSVVDSALLILQFFRNFDEWCVAFYWVDSAIWFFGEWTIIHRQLKCPPYCKLFCWDCWVNQQNTHFWNFAHLFSWINHCFTGPKLICIAIIHWLDALWWWLSTKVVNILSFGMFFRHIKCRVFSTCLLVTTLLSQQLRIFKSSLHTI